MIVQVSLSGYQGPAVTLLCFIDDESDALIVSKQVEFSEQRRKNCVLVSNMDLAQRDFLFEEEMLRDAIATYFRRSAQGTLDIDPEMVRHRPDNKIEAESVSETGTKYRIDPTIDNGQMAVLAAVAYATHINPMNAATEMMDELAEFYTTMTI